MCLQSFQPCCLSVSRTPHQSCQSPSGNKSVLSSVVVGDRRWGGCCEVGGDCGQSWQRDAVPPPVQSTLTDHRVNPVSFQSLLLLLTMLRYHRLLERFRQSIVIRPPDIICRRTYVLPRILSSFFFYLLSFRRLISELAERNPTKIGHMLGSNCDLKMHV